MRFFPTGLTPIQKVAYATQMYKALFRQQAAGLDQVFARFVDDGSVVLDVGAHSGHTAKLLSRRVGSGRIYAFEPSPYTRSLLERTVRFKRLNNVTIVPFGLSDEPGENVLSAPLKKTGAVGFGLSHLGADTSGREVRRETVRLTTLDAFADEEKLSRLDFIKADIEGWEFRMIKGGLETIKKFRPPMVLELTSIFLARASNRPEEVWETLSPLGYKAWRVKDIRGDVEIKPEMALPEFSGNADYLFMATD